MEKTDLDWPAQSKDNAFPTFDGSMFLCNCSQCAGPGVTQNNQQQRWKLHLILKELKKYVMQNNRSINNFHHDYILAFYYITDISSFLGVCSHKTPSQLIMKEGFNKMKEVSCCAQ